MELRQLIYFERVARRQHVTQAAEELHIAQSAISRQIHLLESELQVRLFVQKGRNLQLTVAGQLFLKRVESILAELEHAVQEVRNLSDPESGEVRIGFPHSLGVHLVPLMVSRFRVHHPQARFRLLQGSYTSLIRDVEEGIVDLALISPMPEGLEQVTGDLLLSEELFVVLPPNHPLANESGLTLDRLRHEPFVLFSEGYSLRTIVWDACLRAGFTPRISFEGEETDTIRGLVAAGLGVSLLPEMALHTTGDLRPACVPLTGDRVTRSIGVIRQTKSILPAITETFRKFLMEQMIEQKINK
jgi:LysR family transcriptional activator of glutamate synthase operon